MIKQISIFPKNDLDVKIQFLYHCLLIATVDRSVKESRVHLFLKLTVLTADASLLGLLEERWVEARGYHLNLVPG